MAGQLRAALRAGAVGFTTSRTVHHETSDDRPVASRLAVVERGRAAWSASWATLGTGIFERPTSRRVRPPIPRSAPSGLGRMRALAADTGVPMTFGHGGRPAASGYLLDFLETTPAAGAAA